MKTSRSPRSGMMMTSLLSFVMWIGFGESVDVLFHSRLFTREPKNLCRHQRRGAPVLARPHRQRLDQHRRARRVASRGTAGGAPVARRDARARRGRSLGSGTQRRALRGERTSRRPPRRRRSWRRSWHRRTTNARQSALLDELSQRDALATTPGDRKLHVAAGQLAISPDRDIARFACVLCSLVLRDGFESALAIHLGLHLGRHLDLLLALILSLRLGLRLLRQHVCSVTPLDVTLQIGNPRQLLAANLALVLDAFVHLADVTLSVARAHLGRTAGPFAQKDVAHAIAFGAAVNAEDRDGDRNTSNGLIGNLMKAPGQLNQKDDHVRQRRSCV
jgi:hypothetical protein